MARFLGRPSINDHLDNVIGSWFGNSGRHGGKDHGSRPHNNDETERHSWPDLPSPHHDDGDHFPPIKGFIKH